MKFPYSLNIAPSIDTGDEIVLLRPEIPIRIHGPAGEADVLALVDTGADNSIFPLSVATDLGIKTVPGKGPGATAFGGRQIALSFAEVVLELTQDDTSIRWRARLYFADFPNDSEKAVILGQEGFLDYFTATFIDEDCVLVLEPNKSIPLCESRRFVPQHLESGDEFGLGGYSLMRARPSTRCWDRAAATSVKMAFRMCGGRSGHARPM